MSNAPTYDVAISNLVTSNIAKSYIEQPDLEMSHAHSSDIVLCNVGHCNLRAPYVRGADAAMANRVISNFAKSHIAKPGLEPARQTSPWQGSITRMKSPSTPQPTISPGVGPPRLGAFSWAQGVVIVWRLSLFSKGLHSVALTHTHVLVGAWYPSKSELSASLSSLPICASSSLLLASPLIQRQDAVFD